MRSRTNLIVSHGGRHGKGGTYLRGQKINQSDSENVPNRLMHGNSAEAWLGQPNEKPGAKARAAKHAKLVAQKDAEKAGKHAAKARVKAGARTATNAGVAQDSKESPEAKALTEAVRQDEATRATETGTTPRPVKVETKPAPEPPAPPPALQDAQDAASDGLGEDDSSDELAVDGLEPVSEPEPEPDIPEITSRRQLTIMRKAELIDLADKVGVDSDGKADDIRERLKVHFFGEDDTEE